MYRPLHDRWGACIKNPDEVRHEALFTGIPLFYGNINYFNSANASLMRRMASTMFSSEVA